MSSARRDGGAAAAFADRGGGVVKRGGIAPDQQHIAAFTKCLADRGKTDGVHVNCIHPSIVETDRTRRRIKAEIERTGRTEQDIRTDILREFNNPIRVGTVEDVGDLVTFIVSSRATWLQGATIDLDGGEIPVL